MIESHSSPEKTSEPGQPDDSAREKRQRSKVQEQLDDALADSFPASDPVSIVTSHQEEYSDPPESK